MQRDNVQQNLCKCCLHTIPCYLSKGDTCTHGKRLNLSWYSICTVPPCPCIWWQNFASSDDHSPLHRRSRPVRSWVRGRSCNPSVSPGCSLDIFWCANISWTNHHDWLTHFTQTGYRQLFMLFHNPCWAELSSHPCDSSDSLVIILISLFILITQVSDNSGYTSVTPVESGHPGQYRHPGGSGHPDPLCHPTEYGHHGQSGHFVQYMVILFSLVILHNFQLASLSVFSSVSLSGFSVLLASWPCCWGSLLDWSDTPWTVNTNLRLWYKVLQAKFR